jgi:intracellular multiplication protein IcmP
MALWGLCTNVGRFFRIPVCLALAALAVRCYFRASSGRFTRQLTLETLAVLQANEFPVTKAYLGRDLKLVDPAEGLPRPLDPALHISEWISRYARRADQAFDEAGAYAALQHQLGPRWQGVGKAEPHVQCLALGFWLHAQVRRQDALDVLSGLSAALQGMGMEGPAGPEKPLLLPSGFGSEMRRLIGHTRDMNEADVLLSGHAYTAPALMTLLSHARREAGVMNPGLFAALKLVDRPLWWALQSLGFPPESGPLWRIMPAPCIEATAALEHWQTECEAGRPLVIPAITSSLNRIRVLARQTPPT